MSIQDIANLYFFTITTLQMSVPAVVSIGVILTFKVIFTPLENGEFSNNTSPFHLRHQYLIVLFKQKEGRQQISYAFLTAQGRLIHRCLRL